MCILQYVTKFHNFLSVENAVSCRDWLLYHLGLCKKPLNSSPEPPDALTQLPKELTDPFVNPTTKRKDPQLPVEGHWCSGAQAGLELIAALECTAWQQDRMEYGRTQQ